MSHVANGIYSTGGDHEDIWTYDLARPTPTRLTFTGDDSFPIWSPDGRWITFIGIDWAKSGLYWVASDAGGKPELLTGAAASARPHSWTPDGKTLVFSQTGDDKHRHLGTVTVPGGRSARLHEGDAGEIDGEVSPDGHWIAYLMNPTSPGIAKSMCSRSRVPALRRESPPMVDRLRAGRTTGRTSSSGISPRIRNWRRQTFSPGRCSRRVCPGRCLRRLREPRGTLPSMGTATDRRLEVVINWFDELNRLAPVK